MIIISFADVHGRFFVIEFGYLKVNERMMMYCLFFAIGTSNKKYSRSFMLCGPHIIYEMAYINIKQCPFIELLFLKF